MKIFLYAVVAASAAFALTACAPKAKNVKPSYVPQALYNNLSCNQIASEAVIVSRKAREAAGKETRHRHQDQAIVATGLVIFWPALFFTHGHNSNNSAYLAGLKGEMQALKTASAQKQGGIVFKNME